MKRNDFGLWGLELSPEEFARALAALGVFEGAQQGLLTSVPDIKKQLSTAASKSEGLLRWRVSRELLEKLAKLKKPGAARAFAQAWEAFKKSYKKELRFELHLDRTDEYFWIAEQLLGSAVGATSLYVRVDEPQTTVGWNWPLRIGFLEDDASGQLRQGLEKAIKKSGLKVLVDFVALKSERDDCDLLLFPQTLQGALSELLKTSWNPRADCVLVLGGSKDLSGRLTALMQAVRSQARTSGVGLLSIQATQRADWLKSLIAQLSHNNPLDMALFKANREMKAAPPLLAASRRLIDLTLVSRTAARIGQALKRKVAAAPPPTMVGAAPPPIRESPIIPPSGSIDIPSEGSSKGGGKAGSSGPHSGGGFESVELPFESVGPPQGRTAKRSRPPSGGATKKNGGGGLRPEAKAAALEVAGELESVLPPNNWKFESAGATEMATRSRKAESISKEIPRKAEERRIKSQIFDATSGKEQKSALKPDTSYAADISIGLPDKKGVSADKPFAIEELPPSEKGHTLTVVFTVLSGKPAQPVAEELFLPPEGSTT